MGLSVGHSCLVCWSWSYDDANNDDINKKIYSVVTKTMRIWLNDFRGNQFFFFFFLVFLKFSWAGIP
jgi:hypothetical protein